MTDPPARGHVLDTIPIAKTCTDHTVPHQTPFTPLRNVYLSLLLLTTQSRAASCSQILLGSTHKQKRRRLLQLNTDLECPGPCTQPLDPASVAHAIRNYKINRSRSLNASDAINTILFYDLESIDNWRAVTIKPANNYNPRNPTNKNNTVSTLRP